MKLVLEVEFLTGLSRAAKRPSDDVPDWPPQPDRMFSALVASWSSRGQQATEKSALEWLEEQDPPAIHASDCSARTAPDVFVPPNDMKESKADKTYLKVLPPRRPRQPRRFPVARPYDSVMSFIWDAEPSSEHLACLDSIARDVAYLGHSASFVRCRFRCADQQPLGRPAHNRVYRGRLAELMQAHADNPIRPRIPAAASNLESIRTKHEPTSNVFVLEAIDGKPDIRSAPLICRAIRRSLMSGYRRAFGREQVPEIVSGHTSSGYPTREPHLMIAPLAFVGHVHADGLVRGFALIPPKPARLFDSPGFRRAFSKITEYNEYDERRVLELGDESLGEKVRLSPCGYTTIRSLSFEPYTHPAKIWASVTPMVLDRHLKRHDDEEIRELVAGACEHVGLPRPNVARIQAGKHAAFAGVPPAQRLAREPPWARWQVPGSFRTRWLTHVVIDFEREVSGPVMLGAGRFTGLGLLRPLGV